MSSSKKTAEKDREARIGEHRFYLGEDNTIYIDVVGEQDEKTALAMKEAVERLISGIEGKLDVLADNSRAGKATPEARRIFRELLEMKNFGKVAICGGNPVARVLASFVIGISRKKDVRFFRSREKALAWLKK
jgi:hypothetical protein